jgi:TonB family protein
MRNILVISAIFLLSIGSHAFAQSTPDPSPNDFIEVDQEPEEMAPLGKLIVYPESARRSGLEGKVMLQALIGKDGSVEKVEVLSSEYDVFKDAAIDAMKREKFTPARQNGTPIKIWVSRSINFRLNPGESGSDNRQRDSAPQRTAEWRPPIYFQNMINMSLDSARRLFRLWGDVQEDKEKDGIHLHSDSRPGFANSKFTVTADAIVDHLGLVQAIIVYSYSTDAGFASGVSTWGLKGPLAGTSDSTMTELPNALLKVEGDVKARTILVELDAK